MQIIQAPDKFLAMPVRTADLSGVKLGKIVKEMTTTLLSQKDPEGVGLAANQVGLPYRLFLARFSARKDEPVRVFINPQIVGQSEEFLPEEAKSPLEGCLSVPKYYGSVKRRRWVKVRFGEVTGSGDLKMREETFTGFPATVIQHEMDHLDGRIFVERILEQKGKLYKVTRRDKKGKEIWEEVDLTN